MIPKSFLCIFLIVQVFENIRGQAVQERYFDQSLDHFGKIPGTWKQRYLENREYFKPGGPVFIRFGGPIYSPVTPESLQSGSMVQYAKEQNANIIVLESRYFGRSRPTKDLSTSNLEKFHTIKQTFDDSARFIRWMRMQPDFQKSKVVAFAPLYQGSKINNIMISDPTLIDIGVMSSPATEVKYELPEYYGTAGEELVAQNQECATTVHDAISCLGKIARGETCEGHNLADLKQTFNLCDDLDPKIELDSFSLVYQTVQTITSIMLLNNPDPNAAFNVEKSCKIMGDTSEGLSHMDKLAKVVKQVLKLTNRKCLDFRFEKMLQRLQTTEWDVPGIVPEERAVLFQRCNEAALIKSFRYLRFGENLDNVAQNYTLELCKQVFNINPERVKENTERTNLAFARRKVVPKCGIYISGTENLFRAITVTKQEEAGDCNRAVSIRGGSFARDETEIMPEGKSHPPGLRDAQLKVGNLINEWLRTGNCCMPQAKRFFDSPSFIYPIFK